jgi:hypothetical protein
MYGAIVGSVWHDCGAINNDNGAIVAQLRMEMARLVARLRKGVARF